MFQLESIITIFDYYFEKNLVVFDFVNQFRLK